MRANYNARPCDGERKAAGATTMENNGKNNAQNNGNSRKSGRVLTSGCERLTSSDVVACGPWRPNEKRPPTRAGDNSHKSETRISAIADFAREGKQEKKALQLSLASPPGTRQRHGSRSDVLLLAIDHRAGVNRGTPAMPTVVPVSLGSIRTVVNEVDGSASEAHWLAQRRQYAGKRTEHARICARFIKHPPTQIDRR
jgi:hypothetical protein